MSFEDVDYNFDNFLLNFCYCFKNHDDSKVYIENIIFYIIIKRALNDCGLWENGREKLKDEILEQIISGQKNKLSIAKNDKSKELFKSFEKIDFRDIKITRDEFDDAVKDVVEYIKFQIEGLKDWNEMYERALEKGNKAIKEVEVKNKREELENAKINLKSCDEGEKSEFEQWVENLEKSLEEIEKGRDKKFEKNDREYYRKNIEERKEIVEEKETKLKDIKKIKFEEVEELSKNLIIKN